MAPETTSDEARRKPLLALLAEIVPDLDSSLSDDTPLISSGLLESMALLRLALWVEERIDSAVDITSFDLVTEWDTVTGILGFVTRHRALRQRADRPEHS